MFDMPCDQHLHLPFACHITSFLALSQICFLGFLLEFFLECNFKYFPNCTHKYFLKYFLEYFMKFCTSLGTPSSTSLSFSLRCTSLGTPSRTSSGSSSTCARSVNGTLLFEVDRFLSLDIPGILVVLLGVLLYMVASAGKGRALLHFKG